MFEYMFLRQSVAELYLPILILFCVASGISILLTIAPRFLSPKSNLAPSHDKFKAYECGFDQLTSNHSKFDVKFYLVAILFVVFDLEIMFLVPWAVNFQNISMVDFCSVMVFLGILTLGFAYEWKRGALNWH